MEDFPDPPPEFPIEFLDPIENKEFLSLNLDELWNGSEVTTISSNPSIYSISNFISPEECEKMITHAKTLLKPSIVVGKGDGEVFYLKQH